MAFSSTVWLFLIVFGVTIAALGNIQFNLARDREKGLAASEKAVSILAGECKRNLIAIGEMRKVLADSKVLIKGFETTAWNVVSSGGLLVQLDRETLEQITEAYYLIELANKHHANVLDLMGGVRSALAGSEKSRAQYLQLLGMTLDEAEPKLQAIVQRVK